MNKNILILLSRRIYLFSAPVVSLLLILAWHSEATTLLVLLAFVPWFFMLDRDPGTKTDLSGLYIIYFLSVFFWIYVTLWWIKPINSFSHLFTTLLSSLILFLPFAAALLTRFKLKKDPARPVMVFVSLWLILEILHDFNILGFPYLNLGHVLATHPGWIQWYAIGGSTGGTLWIFLVNLLIYKIISLVLHQRYTLRTLQPVFLLLLFVALPPLLIRIINPHRRDLPVDPKAEFYAVHTSVDVFTQKYKMDPDDLLDLYIQQTKEALDSNPGKKIIFWPENAITGRLDLADPDRSQALVKLRSELCTDPGISLIAGAIADEQTDKPVKGSYNPNVLYDSVSDRYYKHYNVAIQVSIDRPAIYKTKGRLVPFGEKVPESKLFIPLVKLFPNLANLNFSSKDNHDAIFTDTDSLIRTNPVICYGIAFSSYTAEQVRRSRSNYLSVILNEGWMKRNKAYMHFNWFTICRAIENNRFTVKSSNEGISGFMDNRGKIVKEKTGSGAAVINSSILLIDRETFFTRYHRIIYGTLLMVCLFLLIYGFATGSKSVQTDGSAS
ncbi:MAG: apolipoprotein N-acyltransferase [Bacteroidota bacterium]